IHIDEWGIDKEINFSNLQDITPQTIPSYPFYQLIKKVYSLPPAFWPYLPGTNVHSVNLSSNNRIVGPPGAALLAKNLQGTKVHTVDLKDNQIGASEAQELAKALPNSQIHT